ncbi:FTR1 family protein [Ferrovibrio terrae]|uniref:FTR1 family protein n=1 Tax=Ferrovibrio terrae TaxID=2594003 RepID=UPI0031382AB4
MLDIVLHSFLIVLREGLEALLVIAALAAILLRAGAGHRRSALAWGAGLALLASIFAAWLFEAVFANVDDLTEAVVMLLVAALLFHVSLWLWRVRNLQAWRDHLQQQVQAALAADSSIMLGLIAFLAVFREGAETILFLNALIDDVPAGEAAVLIGLGAAAVALGCVYAAMTQFASRLPWRPVFTFTSIFLFVLGLRFIGVAMAEFQLIGWLPSDRVALPPWMLALGVNPSLQALGLQLALIAGVAVMLLLPGRRIETKTI